MPKSNPNNYDTLFVPQQHTYSFENAIKDSKEFQSLEKKFHESQLVFTFESEILDLSPSKNYSSGTIGYISNL